MKRIGVVILSLSCVCLLVQKSISNSNKASRLISRHLYSNSFRLQETESGWDSIGPEGGDIVGLAVNPHNKNEIYALTYGRPCQLYKSVHSGQSWQRLTAIDDYCYDLSLDRSNPNIIYILGNDSIFKSLDSGLSWNEYEFMDYFWSSGRISIYQNNPNVIYVTGRYAYNTSPWKYCMAVCKSTDGGETWDVKKINPTSSSAYTESIAISPLDPNVIYIGGRYRNDNNTWHYKLYRSYNGGENWKDITSIIEREPESISIDPSNPFKVYVGNYRGIYRSSDGGDTWQKNAGYVYAYALAIDPINSNIIYAGYWESFYRSVDGGINWTRIEDGICGGCNRLLALSDSSTHIFFGSSAGIYKSDNGGVSWRESHSGIRAQRIQSLAVAPSSSNIIYDAGSDSGLFKSYNFGNSWEKVYEEGRWDSFAINPNDANELLGIRWGRLYKSIDGGSSWQEIFRADYFDDIAINKNNINRIFLAGSAERGSINPMALCKSTDGGANWTTYDITSTDGYAYAIAVDPGNDYNIYISGRFIDNQEWRYALFKSSDGGENWINIDEEIDYAIYDIAIDPISHNKIYVGTWGGVYISEDYGQTWAEPNSYINIYYISIDSDFLNDVFAAGREGVYFSNDGGKTWVEFNDGLIINNVNCLAIDEQNRILYAGTEGGSAYRYNLLDFKTLTISKSSGGMTDPAPGSYRYAPGTEVTITVIPDSGYGFTGWSGDVTGTDSQITITMDSDKSVKANFLSHTLTISSSSGGTTDPEPGSYTYAPGTEVTITAIPDSGYGFTGWSGDVTGTDSQITITMDSDKSVKANFLSHTLTISSSSGGTTDPEPGSYTYAPGTVVTVTAIPDSWCGFKGWIGDASGTNNPITLTMDSNKNVSASFIRIYSPLNFSGNKALNRSVLGIEYINVLSWQANPINERIVKYRIYLVDGSSQNLLEELGRDKFKYLHRKVERDKQYKYAIASVYTDRSEGEPAYVTVN